jgi:hypothetical protein
LQSQLESPLLTDQRIAKQFSIEQPLTAQQLATIVPLHPVTILKWAREGKIPHRRLSARKIVFLPGEIRRWLADCSGLYSGPVGHAA